MQGDRIESLKQTLANLTGAAAFKEIRGYQ
jgi:hypothetical protein